MRVLLIFQTEYFVLFNNTDLRHYHKEKECPDDNVYIHLYNSKTFSQFPFGYEFFGLVLISILHKEPLRKCMPKK